MLCLPVSAQEHFDYAAELAAFQNQSRTEERLTALADRRAAATGEDPVLARVYILRDLSEQAVKAELWGDAYSYRAAALEISRAWEDPVAILPDLVATARLAFYMAKRYQTLQLGREAVAIAETLQRYPELGEALVILARLEHVRGDVASRDQLYERARGLPGADAFALLADKAELLHPDETANFDLWNEALTIAQNQQQPERQALAHEQLGRFALRQGDLTAARDHLQRADELGYLEQHQRPWTMWRDYARLHREAGDLNAARRAISTGITRAEAENSMSGRIALTHELAELEAKMDRPREAFAHMRDAFLLRLTQERDQQPIRATQTVEQPTHESLAAVAELATVRNALREAELARTRARQRLTVATATAASLLAVVLGLAFLLKRRAAAVAELEARNAQLETLRYQLNPHFLFNSLANLNGLILTTPDKARVAVRRLSDFCRLALTRRESPLVPLKEEAERLRAYLDVAAAAEDDDLVVTCEVDPATHAIGIPPLLVQPLVENALKYADEDETGHRRVTISIRSESPATIRIDVTNTGPWIEATATTAKPSAGVGLTNLHQRLAHAYPNRHTLTFTKTATAVTATLTLQTG